MIVGSANADGDAGVAHPAADIDERVRDPGRGPLGGEIDHPLHGRDIDEGHDVDAVHDPRRPCNPAGDPADEARLALVRVDDIGLQRAKVPCDVPHRQHVIHGADRMNEARHPDQPDRVADLALVGRVEIPSVQKGDVEPGSRLSETCGDRVLFRPRPVEAGEDMDDIHCAQSRTP